MPFRREKRAPVAVDSYFEAVQVMFPHGPFLELVGCLDVERATHATAGGGWGELLGFERDQCCASVLVCWAGLVEPAAIGKPGFLDSVEESGALPMFLLSLMRWPPS